MPLFCDIVNLKFKVKVIPCCAAFGLYLDDGEVNLVLRIGFNYFNKFGKKVSKQVIFLVTCGSLLLLIGFLSN